MNAVTNLVHMRSPSTTLLPQRFSLPRVHRQVGTAAVRGSAPVIRVGRSAAASMPNLTQVSGPIANTVAASLYIAVAAAWTVFSYSLFTGKWLFKTTHPGWGIVTGVLALSSILGAANEIRSENA